MYNISQFSIIFDIACTSIIIYGFYYFFRGTQTATIVKGLLVVIALYLIANIAQLNTIKWIFIKFFNEFPLIIVIIFHSEIRHFFSNLGRNHQKHSASYSFSSRLSQSLIELSDAKIGALILVERNMKLQDLLYTGVFLNAQFSIELIHSIFNKNSPLHDGAVIIKNEQIIAAKVFLPAIFNKNSTGTRHGSAISITKERDCTAFIVSEETGAISYAKDGILTPIPNILIEDVVNEAIK